MKLLNTSRRAALITPLLCGLASVAALSSVVMPLPAMAASEDNGAITTETRTVGDFQAVALSGSMDLVVRQGAQQSVQVQAPEKLQARLETVVESTSHGPTLSVRWKKEKGWGWSHEPRIRVTVVVPKLTALVAAGAGDIRLEPFSTPALQVSLSGSGDARLEALTTDELGIRISGSGDVMAKGSAGKLKVNIAGSGDVRLAELKSDDVTVSIAGSGDAAVNAQKTLSVSIAGSGDVTYTGNATVKSSVAGSGSVTKK